MGKPAKTAVKSIPSPFFPQMLFVILFDNEGTPQKYKDAFASGRRNLVLLMLSRNVDYYRLAEIFIDYKKEMLKPRQ